MMNIKKLFRGGNMQYLFAISILAIFLFLVALTEEIPSIEITATFFGLMIVSLLFGIGYEVKAGLRRR